MKKIVFLAALGLLALSMASCGKKSDKGAASAAESASEDPSENSLGATIQKIGDGSMMVQTDDGKSYTFDISKVKMDPAWELMPGDEVQIGYDGAEPADGMAVNTVVMSVPFEYSSEDYNEDPTIYGEITAVDDKSITIREQPDERADVDEGSSQVSPESRMGDSYTLERAAYGTEVTKDGVKVGAFALVSYTGDLKDKAVAYRVCTEDMMEDETSNVIGVKGKLEKFEESNPDLPILYLKASDGTELKFTVSDDENLKKLAKENVGKEVEVDFADSLRARVSSATNIKPLH